MILKGRSQSSGFMMGAEISAYLIL